MKPKLSESLLQCPFFVISGILGKLTIFLEKNCKEEKIVNFECKYLTY